MASFVTFPLAITFGSPWLLIGMALAAIPIAIHLFHKRRFQETRWAAMRFLLEASRKNTRRLRLEQLLLLTLRTLILLLLPLALARPYIKSFANLFERQTRTHRILILDASFSMGYTTAGESNFDRARRIARDIVEQTTAGNSLNLLHIAGTGDPVIIARPSFQTDDVIREIDKLRLSDEPAQILPALRAVNELLDAVPDATSREVILLTDFQQNSWAPDATQDQNQLRDQLIRIAQNSQLRAIDVGLVSAANVAVTGLTLAESNVIVDRPARLQSTIHNFSNAPATALKVSLYVNGQPIQSQTVDVGANESLQIDYQHTFSETGNHEVEVRSADDNLVIDNRRRLAVQVKQQINVLLVDGRNAGRASAGAAFYVERALNPPSRNQSRPTHIHTRIHHDGELGSLNLDDFDCVIHCNVELFTQREAERMRAYTAAGGSLLFILGDQVNPKSYNSVLCSDPQWLLPAQIAGRVGNAADPQSLYRFATDSLEHPVLSVYRGNPGAGLERPLVLEYFQLQLGNNDRGRVILSFDSGDPVIVEAPLGLGRVAIVSTACDGSRWNTLARRDGGVLVTLMNELLQFLISGHSQQRQLIVGTPITRTLPAATQSETVDVVRPDQSNDHIRVTQRDSALEYTYADTNRVGFYRIKTPLPKREPEMLAVNPDVRESDLQKLQQTRIQRQILPKDNSSYDTVWRNLRRSSAASPSDSSGLSRWLLYAALLLLFVEQIMSWRFDYGLFVLLAVVAAALIARLVPGGIPVAVAVLVLSAAGWMALRFRKRRLRI